jgi:pimeloyl-ACP methyl ester carboxylesterase
MRYAIGRLRSRSAPEAERSAVGRLLPFPSSFEQTSDTWLGRAGRQFGDSQAVNVSASAGVRASDSVGSRVASGFVDLLQLDFDDVSLEVHRYARTGPVVCMLPGLGGGIQRFSELAEQLADFGVQPVAINPRGAGSSTGPLADLRMRDLADDVARVIQRLGSPAFVIGNAFGNRVARYLASDRPDLVTAVILVCAGGEVPPDPQATTAMLKFLDESLSQDERLEAASQAFFAQGHAADAAFIDPGRTAIASSSQIAATGSEEDDNWLAGGSAPMLVVQGAEDKIAPPENGHRLQARWPDRVEVIDIHHAAHAVLSEQPEAVAQAVIEFVGRF